MSDQKPELIADTAATGGGKVCGGSVAPLDAYETCPLCGGEPHWWAARVPGGGSDTRTSAESKPTQARRAGQGSGPNPGPGSHRGTP